jgi:hypothetical protein
MLILILTFGVAALLNRVDAGRNEKDHTRLR